ncbi:MAG: SDR family oxidoreductase [Candidatus Promineofilum sp.]|nr:SDR family oxidoreductase [Promineifilum sp.]
MTHETHRSGRSGRRAALAGLGVALAGMVGWRALRQATADRALLPTGRALITGASSGIGEKFARRLAAAGFDLTLVARREERLRALADELVRINGIRVDVLAADLARDEDIARVSLAIEAQPDLVLLINNAGFGTRGSFTEVPIKRHLDMIRVHDVASVALTWSALPRMVERGRGAIINVSSIAAFFPSGGGSTYTATKAYLNNFSEALAAELHGTGVKVQALCPGFTYSEFHETPEYLGFNRGQIPSALWMSAEQVVDESLAALSGDQVIIVPGRRYQALVAAINSPLRGAIRNTARAIRGRWHPGRGAGLHD